jgi:glycosyltransferase involved in cell wall biosynthesis
MVTALRQLFKVLSLAKRFRIRHFKLGPKVLVKLAIYHLVVPRITTKFNKHASRKRDWLINDSSLTILLTVFNQSDEELGNSISSARSQTGAKVKIIIFDDGSTRGETNAFLEAFRCRENEILIRSTNNGVVAARNELIELVTSDFLLFLDPDDILDGEYVSKAFDLLEKDRSIEIIYPDVLVHDTVKNSFTLWETGPFDLEVLKNVNTLPMSSIVSTRMMKQLGGYSEDFNNGPEDWDLWVRAAMSGVKAIHLSSIGYVYKLAPNSRSAAATDHSDLIELRAIGKEPQFPLDIENTVEVFLTIPWLPRIGGVEKYVKCLMEDLKEAGISAALLITEPDPVVYKDDAIKYRNLGHLVVKRVDFPSDDYYLMALKRLAAPKSVAINFGSPWEFENISKLNSIFSKKICFIFNTEISLSRAVKAEKDFDEFWVAYEKIKKNVPDRIRTRTHTIYTGVVGNRTMRGNRTQDSPFTVGFLGRYSPEKNPDAFLDLAKAAENNSKFKFVMAGEGPLDQRINDRVATLGNTENLGFLSDSTAFFANVDCLVISSEIEGIPLSAMEALSFGIPVISTNVGGMPELLSNERDGFIWTGGNQVALDYLNKLEMSRNDENDLPALNDEFIRKNTFAVVLKRIKELIN